LRGGGFARLKEIPLVAVEIFEDGDGAVGLLARSFEELHAGCLHEAIVTPKMIGVKKKEDAAGGLIANLLELVWSVGLGEKEACAVGTRRR
jgi:hypothetical protein